MVCLWLLSTVVLFVADRAVLLGRADRHDDAATRPKISIDLRSGLQLQLHCFGHGAKHDASEICRVENEL